MNILLIGNGFDLEHGLPTKYSDFLEFCKIVLEFTHLYGPINQEKTPVWFEQEICNNWKTSDSIKKSIISIYSAKYERVFSPTNNTNSSIDSLEHNLDELFTSIHKNIWFHFFVSQSHQIGNNWIDLESEISKVIRILDHARNPKLKGTIHSYSLLDKIAESAGLLDGSKMLGNSRQISNFTSALSQHLTLFIRSLEIYISSFINAIPVTNLNSDISTLDIDCVLSFNYSDTFERLYDRDLRTEYDYIHGKALTSNTLDSCNLVLGIDEYLDDSNKNTDLDFISFKKYYQRILKSTGSIYQSWLDSIQEDYTDTLAKRKAYESVRKPTPFNLLPAYSETIYPLSKHHLYIFGHSLDITDKDVLYRLICSDYLYTHIFYYREYHDDKRTLGRLIQNLVRIIGQDELIRRTGGSHRTIEFIPQTLRE